MVIIVDSFALAITVLREQSIDLIISDVHLENGGSVFDFLKSVKSKPLLALIPFVLFSLEPTKVAKYLADGVQTAARVVGAAKYISMDEFDAAKFIEEIEELLPPGSSAVPVVAKEGE
jgi:CheY-like chemotaxis protein